jgi:nucleoside-diphosphate-sugar epimerase
MHDNFQEWMAVVEAEGAKNVIEACGRAAYTKRCIFTSSLLASIWRGDNVDRVVDETGWSDENFCRENRVHNIFIFIYLFLCHQH